MKRSYCLALGVAVVLASGSVAFAQDVPNDDMRFEVTSSIGKLVDAANRGDVTAVMKMVSEKPEVTVLADGEVYQGAVDIRAHAERLLGQRGKYLFQLGTVKIANVHGLAVATGPYNLRPAGSQTVAARGAVTFVMERSSHGRWIVVHMHRSATAEKPQLD